MTRDPTSVQRQRFVPHQNSSPLQNWSCLIAAPGLSGPNFRNSPFHCQPECLAEPRLPRPLHLRTGAHIGLAHALRVAHPSLTEICLFSPANAAPPFQAPQVVLHLLVHPARRTSAECRRRPRRKMLADSGATIQQGRECPAAMRKANAASATVSRSGSMHNLRMISPGRGGLCIVAPLAASHLQAAWRTAFRMDCGRSAATNRLAG